MEKLAGCLNEQSICNHLIIMEKNVLLVVGTPIAIKFNVFKLCALGI